MYKYIFFSLLTLLTKYICIYAEDLLPLQWENQEGVTQRHHHSSETRNKKSGDFHKPPHSTINLKLIAMNNKESLYRHFYLRHFYNVI